MKPRDRMFVMGVVSAVLLLATWFVWVAPERSRASGLASQVAQAQSTLSAAQAQVVTAEADRAQYPIAYASLVSLGKAVPPESDMSALLYELDQVADADGVHLTSFASGPAAASSAAPGAAVVAGFEALPINLSFSGSFFDLYRLLNRLNQLTVQGSDGSISVSGRLLTIQSTALTSSSPGDMTGTITADAYVLPPGTSPTGGATPSGPTTAAPGAPSAPAPASSTATPALVQPTG